MVDKLRFGALSAKWLSPCKTTQLFWRQGHYTVAEVRKTCRTLWTKQYSEMGTALGAKQENSSLNGQEAEVHTMMLTFSCIIMWSTCLLHSITSLDGKS